MQLRAPKSKGWVWDAKRGIRVFNPAALALDPIALRERDEESGGVSSPKSPGALKSPQAPPRPAHLRKSSHAPAPPMLSLCQTLLLVLVLVVGCVTAAVWHMGQAGTNSMVVQLASSLNISVPELYELGGTLPAGAPATLASESAVAAPDGQQDDAAAPPADRGMAPAPASPAKKAKTSSTLSAEDVLVKAERLGMVSEKSAKQASSGKDAKEGEAKRSAAALQREAERAAARRATREAERAAAEGATAAAEEQPQKEEVATGGEEKGRADRRRSAPSKEEAEGVVAEKEAPKEAPKEKAGGSEEKTRKPQAEAVVERAQAAQQRSKERRERAKAEEEKKEEKETGQTPVVKQPVVKRSAAALQREAERAALRRSEREQKDRAEEATAEDVED